MIYAADILITWKWSKNNLISEKNSWYTILNIKVLKMSLK